MYIKVYWRRISYISLTSSIKYIKHLLLKSVIFIIGSPIRSLYVIYTRQALWLTIPVQSVGNLAAWQLVFFLYKFYHFGISLAINLLVIFILYFPWQSHAFLIIKDLFWSPFIGIFFWMHHKNNYFVILFPLFDLITISSLNIFIGQQFPPLDL